MTWGGGETVSIPNATTWDDITGREWESAGTGLGLWTGGYSFHLYYDLYPWTTPAWTELTTVGILGFNTNRGVKSWWEGCRAGTAQITLVNDARIAALTTGVDINAKMRLTVETSAGETDLFTGWMFNQVEAFDPESATMTLYLFDYVGYTAQQAVPVGGAGVVTTGPMVRAFITAYANGYAGTADIAGIAAGSGLNCQNAYAAGNVIDNLNVYCRGELGLLWIDPSGVWQMRFRDWWYPQPDPIATIGSTDRSAGGTRNDPSLADGDYEFPARTTRWVRPMNYNHITWTGPFSGGTTTSANTGSQSGQRKIAKTVYLTSLTDAANNLSFLVSVEGDDDLEDSQVTIVVDAESSSDAEGYGAVADIGDFLEVAKETSLLTFRRSWNRVWVTGVAHSFTPGRGWQTTITGDPNLALFNFAVPT